MHCTLLTAPAYLHTRCRDVGIQALYFGHDHANDYAGEINGVRLAYG